MIDFDEETLKAIGECIAMGLEHPTRLPDATTTGNIEFSRSGSTFFVTSACIEAQGDTIKQACERFKFKVTR